MPAPSSGAARLADLCAFLQQQADATKRQLARALHDAPAQTVSAALLTLFLLEREKATLSGAAQRALHDAQSLLASCGEELRQISHDLFPPLLEEAGLQPPLRALARKTGVDRIHLHVGDVPRLPGDVEEAAYRFAEEALRSLLAPRGVVTIDLASEGARGVVLAIEGRSRAIGPERKLALLAIEQRVLRAGGTLQVSGRQGRMRLAARFRAAKKRRPAARR